ncbi:hypothetical protein PBAL39_15109 [Pedobacter sp. BAL39]|nr:hypothetical protein PBAL39_15109 [Pedobacter sp. BAL39]
MAFLLIAGCKEDEDYQPIPDIVYVTSTAVTGTGTAAATTLPSSVSGKVSVSPATARVYVNTLKDNDVTVTYTLAGTAVAGTNYTRPSPLSVVIPAGKWYADIQIPVINAPLTGNKTIVIALVTASNDTQIGLGTDRNYKIFTYTLTN